ncbi:MAG: hypothetical protein PVG03_01795 [Desulfarculaceae bacterium]|jgi:hypothetical protein
MAKSPTQKQSPSKPKTVDPRSAARVLREVLERKVKRIAAKGDIDRDEADEVAKIGAALSKLERDGLDLKAAALEIGERQAGFAARWEADQVKRAYVADFLAAFFRDLEREG